MTTIEAPRNAAQKGVSVAAGQRTTIVVKTASVEVLIGGPYTRHGKPSTYGHAALRVITSQGEHIYDFGRYGSTTGEFGAEGEGILRVWTQFAKYIAGENALGRTTHGFAYRVKRGRGQSRGCTLRRPDGCRHAAGVEEGRCWIRGHE